MTQSIVRIAFETRLKTWADARTPALPVAWENVPFTPPVGRYARAFLLPARTQSETLNRSHRAYRGIFQVNLCMAVGSGASGAESLLSSLDAAFAQTFTQGGLRIFLTAPFSAAAAIQAEDRYIVPVSAQYRADTV
jgi:hypothetical protein